MTVLCGFICVGVIKCELTKVGIQINVSFGKTNFNEE